MTNTPDHSCIPEPEVRKTRREFLKITGLAALAVASGMGSTRDAAAASLEPERVEEDSKANEEVAEASEHGLSGWLDEGTAWLVGAEFARHVMWNGAKKGIALGPKSAAEMSALAFARCGLLHTFGGEAGEELSKEELHEIKGGLLPLPLLVALSDATTTELKIDEAEIFKAVEGSVNPEMDYKNIQKPSLGESVAIWNEHLNKVNEDIVKKTAQIAAITSVLAPLGTTYTSSSLANKMKEDILRMLYEQSFAIEVVRIKEGDAKRSAAARTEAGLMIDEAEVRDKAIQRADKCFNGPQGFSKLMFTLAANTQGSWGLGDPPEIYFAINHAAANPGMFAAAHMIGALNSEIYTVALNAWWLKYVGINQPGAFADFTMNQLRTWQTLVQTIGDSDLRNVSFSRGGKFIQRMIDALNDETDPGAKIRNVLRQIPKARLQFSLVDYLKQKGMILDKVTRKLGGKLNLVDDPLSLLERIEGAHAGDFHSEETFAGSSQFVDMAKAFTQGNMPDVHGRLKAIERLVQAQQASELSDLFAAMLDEELNTTAYDPKDQVPKADVTAAEETPDSAIMRDRRVLTVVSAITQKLLNLDGTDRDTRISNARVALDLPADTKAEGVYSALKRADRSTLAAAMAQFTAINGVEDIVKGLEDGAKPGETIDEALGHADSHHGLSLLSHSAREVLWALLTQIPSVPAMARLAKLNLPRLAGVNEGEVPSPSKLKNIVMTLLPIEAGLSGLADNVAAYLFAENVMISFFKSTFGEEVFTKYSNLQTEIGIIAKMIAEQAGSLTQVGNGPNFSQDECILLVDEGSPSGVGVDRKAVKMGDTLPHKNWFSAAANVSLVSGAIAYLWKKIDNIESTMSKKSPRETSYNTRARIAATVRTA